MSDQRRRRAEQWRAAHPGYMSEYCKEWRARKKRQAIFIDRVLEQINQFEATQGTTRTFFEKAPK